MGTEEYTQIASPRSPYLVSGPQVVLYAEPTTILDASAYAALDQTSSAAQMGAIQKDTSSEDASLIPARQTPVVLMTMSEHFPAGVGIGVGAEGVGFGVGSEEYTQIASPRSPYLVSGPQVASYPVPTTILDASAYAALDQTSSVAQMGAIQKDTSSEDASLIPARQIPVVLITMSEHFPAGVGIGVRAEGVGFGVGSEEYTQIASPRSPYLVSGPQVVLYAEPTTILDASAYAALDQTSSAAQMGAIQKDTSSEDASLIPARQIPVVLITMSEHFPAGVGIGVRAEGVGFGVGSEEYTQIHHAG